MSQREIDCCWKLGLAISFVIGGVPIFGKCAQAQIIPDGTLGNESSIVEPNVVINGSPSDQINGGTIRGTNLFHSFQEFNVGEKQRVYFSNPDGINNILTRVTGGSRSEILGKLGVLGNANLFIINPKGFIFGPNASLDLKGSFIASTASSLKFADSSQFSANAPQTSPLLTVSVPSGLQFGETSADISVQEATLEVQPVKTLGLVGSGVTLEGGYLGAPGGRIELGSVASNSLVNLNSTVKGWSLGYQGVQKFQNIQLIKGRFSSEVNASGSGGGDIQVQGRQVMIADGSRISSITQGAEAGGILTVTASESVELIGEGSTISSSTIAAGHAGNIEINTRRLLVSNRALISTVSNGRLFNGQLPMVEVEAGRGGNLTVNASESVELKNGGGFFSGTQGIKNAGNAGDIDINTRRLLVENGSQISASTNSKGQGGALRVNASDSVELSGEDSGLSGETRGTGDAGNLTIETARLIVNDGAEVTVSSAGTKDAGDIEVTADSIELDNEGKLTATSASGGGGNIRLLGLDLLLLRDNSEISTTAGSDAGNTGNGGNITIDTDLLIGSENSDITANAFEGEGGFIQINAQGIFGLEVNETDNIEELRRNNTSDISASSQKDPSLNGRVEINRLEAEPSSGLVTLPAELVDVSGIIAQGCGAGGGNVARAGKFVATGRGGLPPTPTEALRSDAVLADLGTPVQGQDRASAASPNLTNSQPTPLVEAQGWVIGSQGEVVLTAKAPTVTRIPWLTPTSCNAS